MINKSMTQITYEIKVNLKRGYLLHIFINLLHNLQM